MIVGQYLAHPNPQNLAMVVCVIVPILLVVVFGSSLSFGWFLSATSFWSSSSSSSLSLSSFKMSNRWASSSSWSLVSFGASWPSGCCVCSDLVLLVYVFLLTLQWTYDFSDNKSSTFTIGIDQQCLNQIERISNGGSLLLVSIYMGYFKCCGDSSVGRDSD